LHVGEQIALAGKQLGLELNVLKAGLQGPMGKALRVASPPFDFWPVEP